MKKIMIVLLGVFILSVMGSDLNAQTRKRTTKTQIKKAQTTRKATRVSRNNVTYKKSRTKVVAVRTLPSNRRVIKHNGQSYHYANNRFYRYNGGRYLPVKPVVGLRIRTLPIGFRTVVFNRRNYYEYDGVYYAENDDEYEVIVPEVGTLVYELPDNYEKVEIDGLQYYESNNVLYEKVQIDDTRAYEVVGIVGD